LLWQHIPHNRSLICRLHSPALLQEEAGRRTEAERQQIALQIEAERRATEKYKASLDKEVQREKALAEAEGRAEERRRNKDIYRE
jgi:ATPase family AAA domain-containing protein 3A/B